MKESEKLLEELIVTELRDLKLRESMERDSGIDNIVRLYKLKIDQEKICMEMADKRIARKEERDEKKWTRKDEREFQEAQLKLQKIEKYLRLAIDVTGIVLPVIFYGVWYNRGLKFEESGTFTSATFRNLFSKFKPGK